MKTINKVLLGLAVVGSLTALSADGAGIYKKCIACHGATGEKKALGKSAVITGQDVATTIKDLTAYKAGSLNKFGMGGLMRGQVSSMNTATIKSVAEYIAGMK